MRRLGRYSAMEEEDDQEHGIDLAPMLDFVLNLLIFFIITAAFSKQLGFERCRPSPASRSEGFAAPAMYSATTTAATVLLVPISRSPKVR